MRSLVLVLVVLAGCTDGTLGGDTAYRRLVDHFDSYDQCIADPALAICYQTLTLCDSGRALMNLENRLEDGRYEVEGAIATLAVAGTTIAFDLDAQASAQLPGRHPWELVTPSFYGCDVR